MKKLIKSYNGTGQKKILIISGVHGNEMTSLYASMEALRFHNNLLKYGSKVTFVIGYNEKAIQMGTRGVEHDVNRSIDIRPEFQDLKKLIDTHDVIIDLHSSYECYPFVLIDNDEYANKILNWCIISRVPYLVRDFPDEGTTIKKYSLENGKLGITLEMEGIGKINHLQVQLVLSHIVSLLKHIDKIDESKKYEIKNAFSIEVNSEGVLKRIIEMGDFIEENELIGYLFDYDMNRTNIKSSGNGFLLVGPGRDFVDGSGEIFNVQPTIFSKEG